MDNHSIIEIPDLHSLWRSILDDAKSNALREPSLLPLLKKTVTDRTDLMDALRYVLAIKLETNEYPAHAIINVLSEINNQTPTLADFIGSDLHAFFNRDPACNNYLSALLFYKGLHALEAYRYAHVLWVNGRTVLASYFQNRVSEVFGADIHPACTIGAGIFIDHGTSLVIGETSVIGDNVSILHEVTLGGTGKQAGDRHPKVGSGVLIGAGAKILGNVTIGVGAKIGAGSVVLKDIPAHRTAVGNPARVIGEILKGDPAIDMNQMLR